MRIANPAGRAVPLFGDGALDVEKATAGGLPPEPQELFLLAPVPTPRQNLATGVDHPGHAAETVTGSPAEQPTWPQVFTKFPSCPTGPTAHVALSPGGLTDREVELVVVMGRRAHRIAAADAWGFVAGPTVGQDLSERLVQLSGAAPQQYSLGKSYQGFGPMGPRRRHPGRTPGPRRPGHRLRSERGADAAGPDIGDGLLLVHADREGLLRHPAAPGRPALHRYARGDRRHPHTSPLPRPRRGPDELDREHRPVRTMFTEV